jgi:rSAM/selenodomain-associated transferase 1
MMVKAPRAGAVKTRLVPPLTSPEAAALASCFARDTLACAQSVMPEVIAAYAPADGRDALEAVLTHGNLLWLEQQGEDLGARLEAAAAHAFALGCSPVILVGTDSPTLCSSFIKKALDSLSAGESDVALGPTDDGGYYLVGLRQPSIGLFRNIAWSTTRVFNQTAANAARLGLRLLELPRWYDVDTPADLSRLRDELSTDEEARTRAPHTYGWLLSHAASLPALA